MAADPEDVPALYDHPTIEGVPLPGTRVVRTGGGERSMKVEQMQEVGYAGAFTVAKIEDMATVTYRIDCADRDTRAATRSFLEVLRKGQKQRPKPAVYRFSDPALEHNEVRSVVTQKIGPWVPSQPSGMWSVEVSFSEWKKRVPIGGSVAPRAKTGLEKELEEANATNKALKDKLDAMAKDK